MERIEGIVERIVFRNEENGFTVVRLLENGKASETTAVGCLFGVQEGELLICEGFWKEDKRFGRQFSIQSFEVDVPSTTLGIEKYLASGAVAGIGPVIAKRIVDFFGEATLEILDMAPHRLKEVEGIGKKKQARIQKDWANQKDVRQVMIFLQNHGISPAFAQRIYKQYEQSSVEKVKENPYRLAADIVGIGFKKADAVAQQLGIEKDAEVRIEAGLQYVLKQQARNGHTCVPYDSLQKDAAVLLSVPFELADKCIRNLASSSKVIIRTQANSKGEYVSFVWLPLYYQYEQAIVNELARLLQFEDSLQLDDDWEQSLEEVTQAQGITLAEQQEEAVVRSIKEKVHIITGGPGTGKSTITKVVLEMCVRQKAEVLLVAPTGRASKRLAEITKCEAFTIHNALTYDFATGGFKKNRYDPLTCDVLIVDEASMIDTYLMASLLEALPNNCKLILVGDIDQLPSVGAGNVLGDLMESEKVAVSRLTEIFRQAVNSTIVTNAHKINQGIFPTVQIKKESDFFFIHERQPQRIIQNIKGLISKRLPKAYQFNKLKDIQLLCPMNKGKIGTVALNEYLQLHLNPNKKDEDTGVGPRKLVVGDKVIQTRNNYDKGVFNGDIGFIQKIVEVDKQLFVNFDGAKVEYEFSELIDLELAYAVSVHKYQGSESPCVILPIHDSYHRLLYKNLLYTGITRGKQLVILVGTKTAINTAIKNNKATQRYTGLTGMLKRENKGLPEIKILPMLGAEGYEEWVEAHGL